MVAVLESRAKSNALGVLIRQSSTFTSYNFASFVQEAYQQNTTVYACIQEYVKAWASCPIIIKRGDEELYKTTQSQTVKQSKLLSITR